jgi:hypothetical protein
MQNAEITRKINGILMRWNPIGVDDEKALSDEYLGYISEVIDILHSEESLRLQKLESYLAWMIQYIGLNDSPHDYTNEIKNVAIELLRLKRSS